MPRKRIGNDGLSRTSRTRRPTRKIQTQHEDIPDVFKDMLAEAYAESPDDFAPSSRPVKRRKIDLEHEDNIVTIEHSSRKSSKYTSPEPEQVSSVKQQQQTLYNAEQSDEDSDVEFEDVELNRDTDYAISTNDGDRTKLPAEQALHLDLEANKTTPTRQVNRRKPITKELRLLRLSVHKWHILCLLMHLAYRNQWCDNTTVHGILKPLISRKILRQLHTDESRPQAERNFVFHKGIEEVCAMWKQTFTVTAKGLRRANWREDLKTEQALEEADDPIDLDDFKRAAETCTGSRDIGAQLFCALLRSIAVEARLVHSLQVLPFATAATISAQQKSPLALSLIHAEPQNFGTSSPRPRKQKKPKQFEDSPYPITWVEVLNPATAQWMPLDPLVRNTINKPRTGFEPPLSDPLNHFAYVIAFEDDGSARDVTLRYTSQFNAKIRQQRIDSTTGGEKWWRKTMSFFVKRHPEPRDEIEDAALIRKRTSEGMPKNVQDFKGHPLYVLERHLRRNEVLEPRREVGKFSSGVGKKGAVEGVFRRGDVKVVRSSDAWYRRGRDVKLGEQPLKRAEPKRNSRRATSVPMNDEGEDEIDDSVALYSEEQTQLYIPPPITNGKVPRNGFGNLDVYVSSMIPAGGVHIRHPMAGQAAKVLGVDAVSAVTGFVFKGRQGTAVIDGVVVAKEYTAAMLAVIEGLQDNAEDENRELRSTIITTLWKKMYDVLRIRARIEEQYGPKSPSESAIDHDHENNDKEEQNSSDGYDARDDLEIDRDDDDSNDPTYHEHDEGGFMPETEATAASKAEESAILESLRDRKAVIVPDPFVRTHPIVVPSPHKIEQPKSAANGGPSQAEPEQDRDDLFGDDESDAGGFIVDDNDRDGERDVYFTDGGFVPERDAGSEAGGFIPEDETTSPAPGPEPVTEIVRGMPAKASRQESSQREGDTKSCHENAGGLVADRQAAASDAQAVDETHRAGVPSNVAATTAAAAAVAAVAGITNTTSADLITQHNMAEPGFTSARSTERKRASARESEAPRTASNGLTTTAWTQVEPSVSSDPSMRSVDPEQEDAEEGWLDDAFESD